MPQSSRLGADGSVSRAGVLIGLAKVAATSPHLAAKRKVEYFSLLSQTVLNRCTSPRMPFLWTINPYRGCEFGCKYCYARYTHEYLGMEDPAEFEEKIYAKEQAGAVLRKELSEDPGGAIAIGTATDPYQPAERLFGVTRGILETLAEFRGLRVSLTTKSDLVLRDLDLLRTIAEANAVQVNVTITTLRADLARCLEVRAPRPDLRLAAVAALARAGIPAAVFAMPVLPGITDDPANLESVAKAAAQAGASYFAVNVLFLMPSAQKAFFPFLEEQFPELVENYRRWYAHSAYLRGRYVERIHELARRLREKYRLAGTSHINSHEPFAPRSQLRLFAESPSGPRREATHHSSP